jgi:hypothetical protein
MKITISIPCYGRPQRTRRMLDAVLQQNVDGWEALFIGDCCPVIKEIIDSGEYDHAQKRAAGRGNSLIIDNLDMNYGGWGYEITNRNIQRANGEYLIFGANDDVILPNHFEEYLNAIVGTPNDFMYFNTYVEPYKEIRNSRLEYSKIGHSELIVKTSYAKKMPPHSPVYGHDWTFIENLMAGGGTWAKASYNDPTYIVKSVPIKTEEGID